MIVLYVILGLIALFLAVIIIRAAAFKPKAQPLPDDSSVEFDKDGAVDCLAELIRFKTVSYYKPEDEDNAEFEKLIAKLPELYPKVYEVCEYAEFSDRALLFRWPGKNDGQPTVLMAHYDVVPVIEDAWEVPPFAGILRDGRLWGRGSLDTKVTLNGILFSANTLIAEGFVPENDIYFAFSGCEEINGKGAANIVDHFHQQGIVPALVVDEGGAVVEGVFPGVKEPCALIGLAEKGTLDVMYKIKSPGGHASAPKPHSPLVELSRACLRVEKNPFKSHITPPVAKLFDTLGRHSSFVFKIIFANLWCFAPVLDMICKKSGGELNALMRTTVAFTRMKGSRTNNVIPPEATMISNIRINHEDTIQTVIAGLNKKIKNPNIQISKLNGSQPSRISRSDNEAYKRVEAAVASTWRGSIVSPYLMVQSSDSRYWGRLSDSVYRFSAMDLTSEERATIHGNNESIRLETLHRSVEFYIRLIKSC